MSEPDLSLPWSAAAPASREAADALLPKAPAFARHSRQLQQLSQSQGQSALDVANMLLDSFEQVRATMIVRWASKLCRLTALQFDT